MPQGTNLGPLLFLVFINDIVNVVENCNIRLFADDTCLFIEVEEKPVTQRKVNNDLDNIQRWADNWLITFSPQKTKSMTFSNKINTKSPQGIFLNNVRISDIDTHKHLGLTFSKDLLKWSKYIQDIELTATKRLNVMKYFKFKLDRKTLETIYTSFIRPTLEYADSVWAGTYDIDLNLLNNIQVKAMRIVTGAPARSNIYNLYEETGWESLEKRRTNHILTIYYKIHKGMAPPYLLALLPTTVNTKTTYPLRTANNMNVPFARLECYKRSFFPFATVKWNMLNDEIKQSPTLDKFKSSLTTNHGLSHDKKTLYYYGQQWPSIHQFYIMLECAWAAVS